MINCIYKCNLTIWFEHILLHNILQWDWAQIIKTSHYMLKNISSGRSTHLSSDLTLTFKYDTLGQKVLSEDDI